jgi:hypothetical protein
VSDALIVDGKVRIQAVHLGHGFDDDFGGMHRRTGRFRGIRTAWPILPSAQCGRTGFCARTERVGLLKDLPAQAIGVSGRAHRADEGPRCWSRR